MRKYAKIIAYTTFLTAFSSSYALYGMPHYKHQGLYGLIGLGGSLDVSNTQYKETSSATLRPQNLDDQDYTNSTELLANIMAGARYYMNRFFIGALFEFNPVKSDLINSARTVTDSFGGSSAISDTLKSDWSMDYGLQLGYEVAPNLLLVLSGFGATNETNYQDNLVNTNGPSTITSNTNQNLTFMGGGVGLALNFQLSQHLLLNLGYRYITYESKSVQIADRNTRSGAGAVINTTANIDPSENLVDLSLIAEFD